MLAIEREKLILDYLEKNELATTQHLCELIGVSIATIRRDLNSMHTRKMLVKTHGGAKKIAVADPLDSSQRLASNASPVISSFVDDPYLQEKRSIAHSASALVSSGDVIFLGSGVTCTLLANELKHSNNLMVVTTSVDVVNVLTASSVSLILLGGDVHVGKNYVETLSEYTIDILNQMYFDKAFFTVDGVDLDFGYSITNRKQLPLYKHLLSHSNTCYLMIDHSKFEHQSFTRLFEFDQITNLIIDSQTPQKYLKRLEENNTHVYVSKD
jgi:DeoR/GlpR family transcriptional regulator of sugar metabolism